jgi:diadenosine tetraphosphatase ApaH/serine/threonine PP2A family protein phosphatase
MNRIALFGGIYNNYLALEAAITDARRRGCERMYCLGDLGAFGPSPDRVFPLLVEHGVVTMQGNYDNSIGNDLNDCQCGYTDPRDNYFAKLSYDYTYTHTSPQWKAWMRSLPAEIRLCVGGRRVLMAHGSPRRMNEFLWESTTPTHFLEKLCDDFGADVILATHTGIHWKRELPDQRLFANVGVLGRPENDGSTNVWYAILEANSSLDVQFIPVAYDHERLAFEMNEEGICKEFIETIRTGWWTTCLEILPAKERKRGRF